MLQTFSNSDEFSYQAQIFSLHYLKKPCIVRASDFQAVLLLFGSVPAVTWLACIFSSILPVPCGIFPAPPRRLDFRPNRG
jgi:hypothetical protein